MENKNVLILTMTCGEGHNAMAKSIANEITILGGNAKICDIFETKPASKNMYNKSYLWACKYIPHLYEMVWTQQRKVNPEKLEKSPQVKQIKGVINHFKEVIEEFQPKAIVCVHNSAGAIIAYLKKHNMIDSSIKTITVAFDYVLCPYWNTNKYLDYCITPHEMLHKELLDVGFQENQLVCLGFPVNSKFYNRLDKQEIRNKLNLENKFTFFSIAGGNGLGNSLKLLKNILKTKGDYQVIMVCGKNKKSKAQIDKYIEKNNIKNVYNFGFVNNINELMNASDITFARGGGAGISESFYSGLPVIFRKGLIINEKLNKNIFVSRGCGLEIKKDSDVTKICQNLIDNPNIIKEMQQNIKSFVKPEPIIKIAKFILQD